ncbi:hypothetical protein [Billgrantia ethanolica]|uniref:Uncharacterized protein n=1 Tax=Billgrantia ethanolica TaxID=2733486 RepID=A0ABS9A929_9GAMM|nr:hypothetical protein [Halomonas ethanolica]MCE8005313.1 hypothetical protein [Halomonas ethanolica]
MSDLTSKPCEEPMTSSETPSLFAEPEDHENPSPRKPLLKRLLLVVSASVVLLMVFAGALAVFGGGERGGEDPLQELRLDLAGTQADVLLIEERLQVLASMEERIGALAEITQLLEDSDTELRQRVQQLVGGDSPDARIDALEEGVGRFMSQIEVRIEALSERLDTELEKTEAAVEAAKQEAEEARKAQAARQSSPVQSAAPPRPPFRISGVEHRGGRPYLSIATGSGPVNSLGQVRLLGEREAQGDWQLVSIGGVTAEFNYRGRSVTVPLP